LPVISSASSGPIYWSATYTTKSNTYYVKLANYNGTSTNVLVDIPGLSNVKGAVLTTVSAPDALSANEPGLERSAWKTVKIARGSQGWNVSLDNLVVGVLAIMV